LIESNRIVLDHLPACFYTYTARKRRGEEAKICSESQVRFWNAAISESLHSQSNASAYSRERCGWKRGWWTRCIESAVEQTLLFQPRCRGFARVQTV